MQRSIAFVICVSFVLQGCSSLQGVQVPRTANERAAVKVGETVEVTTRTGTPQRFKVTEVTDDALVGKDVRVAYADMTSLQAMRADNAQTGVVLYIVGGVVLVALVVVLIDSLGKTAAGSTY